MGEILTENLQFFVFNPVIGMNQFLLIARKTDIRVMSLDADTTVDVLTPIKGIKHATGIDYDNVENKVYWTDSIANSITRSYLDGTGMCLFISFIACFSLCCGVQ